MFSRVRKFFSAPVYKDDPQKTQDSLTTFRVSVALLILAAFSIPFIFLLESPIREFALFATGIGVVIWVIAIHLVKIDKLTAAKVIILAVNTVNLFSVIYALGGLELSTIFTTLFLLALANLLFPRRGAVVVGVLLFILTTILYFLGIANLMPEPVLTDDARSIFLIYTFTLFAVAGMMAIASANYQKNIEVVRKNEDELRKSNIELNQLRGSLEERVTERTKQIERRANQLEAISSVARSTASLQSTENLLLAITRLISERFDYYHTGIFLVDEDREFALLMAANSEGGQKMLDRQHKLKLDTNSIVGYVASRGEPRIALDVGADAVFLNNPDLPNTRSEMAIPLRVGGRVIGVLDVQSTEPNAFEDADFPTLATLADQVAIAIENARLFNEARNALKESEETFSLYVKREWASFAEQKKNTGYLFDGKRTISLDDANTRQNIRPLPQTGSLSLEKDTGKINVPIRFRGQVIGFIDVRSINADRKWTSDDILLLEAAADRAALALENARLVESAQKRASREQTIGDISAKIGAVTDMEAIMQAAVEELGRRIGGAAEVTLELESE